jgi:hypothetical protein
MLLYMEDQALNASVMADGREFSVRVCNFLMANI